MRLIILSNSNYNADGIVYEVYREGVELFKTGAIEEASEKFHSLLRINPNYLPALIAVGNCLSQLGAYDKALEFLERALRIDKDNDLAWYNLSKIHYEQGNLIKAETALLKYLNNNQKDARAWIGLGQIYKGQNQPEKLLNAFDTALVHGSNDSLVLYEIGEYYYELGEIERAFKLIHKAVSINPKEIAAMRLFFQIQGDLDEYRRKNAWESLNLLMNNIHEVNLEQVVQSTSNTTQIINSEPSVDNYYKISKWLKFVSRIAEFRKDLVSPLVIKAIKESYLYLLKTGPPPELYNENKIMSKILHLLPSTITPEFLSKMRDLFFEVESEIEIIETTRVRDNQKSYFPEATRRSEVFDAIVSITSQFPDKITGKVLEVIIDAILPKYHEWKNDYYDLNNPTSCTARDKFIVLLPTKPELITEELMEVIILATKKQDKWSYQYGIALIIQAIIVFKILLTETPSDVSKNQFQLFKALITHAFEFSNDEMGNKANKIDNLNFEEVLVLADRIIANRFDFVDVEAWNYGADMFERRLLEIVTLTNLYQKHPDLITTSSVLYIEEELAEQHFRRAKYALQYLQVICKQKPELITPSTLRYCEAIMTNERTFGDTLIQVFILFQQLLEGQPVLLPESLKLITKQSVNKTEKELSKLVKEYLNQIIKE